MIDCPSCGEEFEPCHLCRISERHQQCVDDTLCRECSMKEKWGNSANKKLDQAPKITEKVGAGQLNVGRLHMSQKSIVKRTAEICAEFDIRIGTVGLAIARLELAKTLAESEASQPAAALDPDKPCPFCGDSLHYKCGNKNVYCFTCDKVYPRR